MLTHPTLEKLKELNLKGMAAGLEDQQRTSDIESLTFEERLGLLLDREETFRSDRRLKTRLTKAKLRVKASIEDVDYRAKRNLDKQLLLGLSSGKWISKHQNLLITGPTGVGKTTLPAHSPTKPATRATEPSTNASPDYSTNWRSPKATAATTPSSPTCSASTCWYSTTGASPHSPTATGVTCSNSSTTATAPEAPSSPANYPPPVGTTTSMIPP